MAKGPPCCRSVTSALGQQTRVVEHDTGVLLNYSFVMCPLPEFPEIFVCLPESWLPALHILICGILLLAFYLLLLIYVLCLHAEEFIHICLIWGLSSCYLPAPN